MNDVLESGFCSSPLCFDNVDWFVDEVIKSENKMKYPIRSKIKKNIKTGEDEEDFKKVMVIFVKKV